MSRLSEREIARRLAEPQDAEPPEGLLDRIKAEIPPLIEVGTEVGTRPPGGELKQFPLPASAPPPRRQSWLIAASLFVMVLGGLLAWTLQYRAVPDEAIEPEESIAAQTYSDNAVPEGDAAYPPPPPAVSPPSANQPEARSEAAQLQKKMEALGNLGRDDEGIQPSAPTAPMEVTEALEDQITITAESPLMDERRISTGATASQTELEKIPAARDPWVVMQQTPGVLADRVNVGGNESGQQSEYKGGVVGEVARGAVGAPPPPAPAPAPPPPAQRPKAGTTGGTTGGDAEPNDEAYGDTFYKSAGVNPFVDTDEDRLSTFGLDVDTASYTVTRRYLEDGNLPVPESVRVEEFVNFFHYGDAPPAKDDFAIRAEGAPTPFAPAGYRLLRFNIRGREIRPEDRKPAVLTFVVDISGSMAAENRLGLVKSSLGLLLGRLKPTDKVGLVVYGSDARVMVEPTHDLGRVRAAVDALHTDGSTNAEAGLLLGYDMANRYFRPEGNNRILLCSDGVANVGNTGPGSILERIGKEARKGIELTTLGFGMGNYNDHLMEQLANKGDGRYAYLDTLEEARRVLVEELEGTLETIAKDAKVQVAFSPEVVDRWRLLGYENRDIADEKFRDDTVDAGEIGAGHSVTALYEVKLKPGVRGDKPLAEIRLRWRSEQSGKVREDSKLLRLSQLSSSWERATPALRLASVAAEFAEILRGSYWARGSSLDELFRRGQLISVEQSESRRPQDVAELISLIGKAARLKGKEK
ncbi:MAG TPA: von Willebrand factor type A domain-containing protein [Thermoanaerobaculia bacterium]|jgi:Ca-activated chloride channel family protein|nr:von Willebrand factor type A domain-containing protein [Thermoanaerobaculia bacterium]